MYKLLENCIYVTLKTYNLITFVAASKPNTINKLIDLKP